VSLSFPPSGFTDRTAARSGVRYASWLRRGGGLLVDLLIISMINYLLVNLLSFAIGPIPNAVIYLLYWLSIVSVISIVYATLCLSRLDGQTPGMRVLQIRCVPVRQRGRVTGAQALTRSVFAELLVAIPWFFHGHYAYLEVLPLAAYLWPLIHKRRQTWWDMLAATVVLDEHGY
jgi:uncharacterized RDD family membrane protein YckC